MKRRQPPSPPPQADWLTQAAKKRLDAVYRPPVTEWMRSGAGTCLPWIGLDFARKLVADAPDDALAAGPAVATMRDLLAYHRRTPYVNMLYEVQLQYSLAVLPVAIVAKRCAYEFAVLAGGTFTVAYDSIGRAVDIPLGFDEDKDVVREVTELVADASGSRWVHAVLPRAVDDWIAADAPRSRRYAAFAAAWRPDMMYKEKRQLVVQ